MTPSIILALAQVVLLTLWYALPAFASVPWWVLWMPGMFWGFLVACILAQTE